MLARQEWLANPGLAPALPSQNPPARGFGRIARVWAGRIAQRRALAQLDDRMLRDIGVTRADAQHEAAKPFWRG